MKIKAVALSVLLAYSYVPFTYAKDAVEYSSALVLQAQKGEAAQAQYDLGEAYYYSVAQDYEKAFD